VNPKVVQASFVSPHDFESLLALVASASGDSNSGLFGPDSITWKIDRESALFLGAGRAALLQLAHPWVAAALAEHSNILSSPIRRFHNTFRVVFTMTFGTCEQALRASRGLYALHTRIRGELPEAVGRYSQCSHYEANEISALRWVFATLVESALIAHECVLPPLTPAERDKYYAERKTMAALFGIPAHALPADWAAFVTYCEDMALSDALGVTDRSRQLAQNVLRGAGSWVHPPLWYRSLTAMWMPARLRSEFGLDLDAAANRSVSNALRWLPRIYRRTPPLLRFIGPYLEAEARLAGRSAGVTVRWSNRFWIGESQIATDAETK
jgi:uncharacterized protein (DUF2236 family)